MSDAGAIDQVLADLEHIRDEIEGAADALTVVTERLSTVQHLDIEQAKDDYELAMATATMEAYANDVANGKNQKQRDMQLATYLGQNTEVKVAKQILRKAELQIALAKGSLDWARRNYSIATNRLWALRAMAELHAARLNAAAGVEYQSSRGERVR